MIVRQPAFYRFHRHAGQLGHAGVCEAVLRFQRAQLFGGTHPARLRVRSTSIASAMA